MIGNEAMAMSDKELIEAISRKDEVAFNIFYNRYYRLLYKWAFRRTCDLELTDEITQNFWITIWVEPKIIKTDTKGSANKFMLHHFTYRMLDFLKSSYAKTLSDADKISFEKLENELSYSHVAEEYDIKEFESVINEILKGFPDKMGEIFMMLHRDSYTIKETAEILNINERTVKYKSKQAMDALKKIMEKEGMNAKSFKVVRDVSSSIIYIVFMADKIVL
ncbi:RNA polymerase sigma factor (sigma-70 family) [Dysgonomonas hofstadii]|uniref:RNA polymerase sigma factor (Sigma-70 family) n=1 Tax=Dysgonomonas hofstadii TaxID=637886 RepID=A0A840CPA8_9BACT|nr:RNA polymerase sigma factor [Dysgonomonas hofstadii]MBB4034805.1 RNA polymerase sigma factor (sigma-70 family) [Dysgonomonas hofstadii]